MDNGVVTVVLGLIVLLLGDILIESHIYVWLAISLFIILLLLVIEKGEK